MKKSTITLLAIFLLIFPMERILAQDSIPENDSTIFQSDDYIAKTGLSLVPLPEFMYDPFIGLYVGINSWIFDYGDGKKYPNYYQSLNVIAAYGTKGKTNFSLKYFNYGKQIVHAYLGYTHSTALPFYGANGYQNVYDTEYTNSRSESYITKPFYNYDHGEFRASAYVQDTINGTFFNWKVGFDIRRIWADRVDIAKMNKGVESGDSIPDVPTLYDKYVEWDIINEEEKNGGWANSLMAGMVYDTRDRLTNPMSGIHSEFAIRYSPSFLGNYTSALQLSLIHSQFFTLIREKLSFAYRLRYDGTFGEKSFYARPYLADEIVGHGGTGTLWGINQNRIMAKQFALANFELRAKLIRFKFINQNWHIAAVPLFHMGYMLEELDVDYSQMSEADKAIHLADNYSSWYNSYGLGAKIVMNENTVIGIDWSHSINKGAGGNAVYIGMGYSF